MTTNAVQLELEPRELLGKKVGRLRRAGVIPVHLYGAGMEPRALQCAAPRLISALSAAGGNTPISIKITGESDNHLAFAREIQWDPRRDDLLHVDLLAVNIRVPVTAQVPVVLVGESAGAREVSGTVIQQLRTIDVQALPMEMPNQAEIDLTVMVDSDSVIRVGDIDLGPSATILTDPDEMVARIELPRAEEVVEPVEGEEEEAAAAEEGGETTEEGA